MDDRRSTLAGTIVKVVLYVSRKVAKKAKCANYIFNHIRNYTVSYLIRVICVIRFIRVSISRKATKKAKCAIFL